MALSKAPSKGATLADLEAWMIDYEADRLAQKEIAREVVKRVWELRTAAKAPPAPDTQHIEL